MTAVSLAGLLYRSGIHPTAELTQAFLPNDVANLVIGAPILIGSMWLARRGQLVGLIFWRGAALAPPGDRLRGGHGAALPGQYVVHWLDHGPVLAAASDRCAIRSGRRPCGLRHGTDLFHTICAICTRRNQIIVHQLCRENLCRCKSDMFHCWWPRRQSCSVESSRCTRYQTARSFGKGVRPRSRDACQSWRS